MADAVAIDAHQHYWSLSRGDYRWLTPALGPLYRDFTPEDLAQSLADCRVGATILVQAAATEEETRFLFDIARRHASVAGVVGWVDFESTDVAARIERLVVDGGGVLKGLRPMVQDIADRHWLARPTLDAAFAALTERGLAFDALVTPVHLRVLCRRLQQHPALRAVLDHAGKPNIRRREFEPWASEISEIAQSTHCHCKLSGLLTEADAGADAAELDEYVGWIFRCFGAERVMWGSDWPVLTLQATYRQWFDVAAALVRRHAPGHEGAVFGGTAARFYRIGRHD